MNSVETITIRLTPNARKNAIVGWQVGQDGAHILKVSVTSIAEKGKANKALIALLAKQWRIPKGAIAIVRGQTSRIKVLDIEGVSPEHLS